MCSFAINGFPDINTLPSSVREAVVPSGMPADSTPVTVFGLPSGVDTPTVKAISVPD